MRFFRCGAFRWPWRRRCWQVFPISKVITLTGVAGLVLAPFCAFALNLGTMTAAVACGLIYVVIGIFGATVTGLLTAFPKELVAAIAGVGSAFGGVAGVLALFVQQYGRQTASDAI